MRMRTRRARGGSASRTPGLGRNVAPTGGKWNLNAERGVLTLPDIFAKNYGKVVEVLVSMCTIVSFMMLLAGNLVGMGLILHFLWGIQESNGIWLAAAVVWVYTVSGGLFSVAYSE